MSLSVSKQLPAVSVIIPSYNHSDCLNLRIKTVLDQTFQDFEIIILDDCSTDGSREVLLQYKSHPKVTNIIFNEVNSGSPFKQWQKGFYLSKGQWIWIAESDDYCEPSFLEELVTWAQEDEKVSLAYCQSLMFIGNKVVDQTFCPALHVINEGQIWIAEALFGRNKLCNASMAIFRRKIALKVPDTFTEFRFCGDWKFWTEIALQGKVAVSGKYLNYYNKHSNNVSDNAWTNGLYYLEGHKILLYIMKNVALSDQQIVKGLTTYVNQFINDEDQFSSKDIRAACWDALLKIDAFKVRKIYNSLKRRRYIEGIKKKINLARGSSN